MPRFFVSPAQLGEKFAVLEDEQAAHVKVLRLRCGDAVTLCDGAGTDYSGTISDISPGRVSVVLHGADASQGEPGIPASLLLAYAKGDKVDHVVQKATELGAAEILLFPAARCVSRPAEKVLPKKLERWQKIAASAAEQSGRGVIPAVRALPTYAAAVSYAADRALGALFYENEQAHTFREAIARQPLTSAALMTGPEGGLTEEEVRMAAAAGLQICTLGKRILRCETAPLCALAALMFAAGEF